MPQYCNTPSVPSFSGTTSEVQDEIAWTLEGLEAIAVVLERYQTTLTMGQETQSWIASCVPSCSFDTAESRFWEVRRRMHDGEMSKLRDQVAECRRWQRKLEQHLFVGRVVLECPQWDLDDVDGVLLAMAQIMLTGEDVLAYRWYLRAVMKEPMGFQRCERVLNWVSSTMQAIPGRENQASGKGDGHKASDC